jgi:hypothetical protein
LWHNFAERKNTERSFTGADIVTLSFERLFVMFPKRKLRKYLNDDEQICLFIDLKNEFSRAGV